jgi:hypothetical protein
MPTRKPYADRSDLEKVLSQWKKLSGLRKRNESSAAIVRAATAAELAANYAVRQEFAAKSHLSADFIDHQLRWANGIAGKIDKLLIPLTKGDKHHAAIKKLKSVSEKINAKRNAIAHQGEFCNLGEADEVIANAEDFIETLVKIYEPKFVLKKSGR